MAVQSIGSGAGMMADILRCRPTYGENTPRAPETLIVKLPSSDPKSRSLGRRLNLYKRECDYYQHIAPLSPTRSPHLFHGGFDPATHRFVLVLEDLRGMTATDQETGATPEEAKQVIREIAKLHGHFWDRVDQPPMSTLYDPTRLKNRMTVQLAYLAYLPRTLRHFGEFIPSDISQLAEAYGPQAAAHLADLTKTPQTIVHGDLRLDNIFFGNGQELFLIDWQVSGLGGGLYDVAYFLGASVSTEVRRQIERETLEEYHDTLRNTGATEMTFTECWDLYRSNMLARLLISVLVCGGLDLSDQHTRQMAELALQRSIAAIQDLDAAQFLPAKPPVLSLASAAYALSRGGYKILKALT